MPDPLKNQVAWQKNQWYDAGYLSETMGGFVSLINGRRNPNQPNHPSVTQGRKIT